MDQCKRKTYQVPGFLDSVNFQVGSSFFLMEVMKSEVKPQEGYMLGHLSLDRPTYVGYLSDIQGFPKKTPVSQKLRIFTIYSVMIREVK